MARRIALLVWGLSALGLALGPALAVLGWVRPLVGFFLFVAGAGLGVLALPAGLVAVRRLRGQAPRAGVGSGGPWRRALGAHSPCRWPVPAASRASMTSRPIRYDPPRLVSAAAAPENAGRDLAYPADNASQQRAAYADLHPIVLPAATLRGHRTRERGRREARLAARVPAARCDRGHRHQQGVPFRRRHRGAGAPRPRGERGRCSQQVPRWQGRPGRSTRRASEPSPPPSKPPTADVISSPPWRHCERGSLLLRVSGCSPPRRWLSQRQPRASNRRLRHPATPRRQRPSPARRPRLATPRRRPAPRGRAGAGAPPRGAVPDARPGWRRVRQRKARQRLPRGRRRCLRPGRRLALPSALGRRCASSGSGASAFATSGVDSWRTPRRT